VVVSRQILIDSRFPTVVCAPILTRGHGFSTQVSVGIDEGLKPESGILCDNLVSLRKVELTRFIGSVPRSKVEELGPTPSKWLSPWNSLRVPPLMSMRVD
jgi:mRNA interferase MazF